MAYLGLDKLKLTKVIAMAIHPKELHSFFKAYKNDLMVRGAILRNIPSKNNELLAKFIDLPRSVDSVIQKWLAKSISINEPEPVIAVISFFQYFLLHQTAITPQELQDQALKKYATSTLAYLSMDNPPPQLIDYFSVPFERSQFEDTKEEGVQTETIIEADVCEILNSFFTDKEPADLSGKRQLAIDLYYAIRCLILYNTSKYEEASQCLPLLSPSCGFKHLLHEAINEALARASIPRQFYVGDEFDYDNLEIIASCHAPCEKHAFLTPLAAINSSDEIFLFEPEKCDTLFPLNGQLITFPSQKLSWLPAYEEIAIWQVERRDTEKPVKTIATINRKRSLHPLYFIDCPSTDVDQIRERIKTILRDLGQSIASPVFCLDSELYIAIQPNQSLTSVDNNSLYANMRAWVKLPIAMFNSKSYIIGPLPVEDRQYNCAPSSFTLSSLLKNSREDALVGLTKKQLQTLCTQLDSLSSDYESSQVNYLKKGVQRILDSGEELDAVVNELMQTDKIESRIKNLVEKARSIEIEKMEDIKSEISTLQAERSKLLGQIEQNKADLRHAPDRMIQAIHSRFNQAKSDGIQELANIALFQAFLSPNEHNNTCKAPVNLREPLIRNADVVEYDISSDQLHLFDLTKKTISALHCCCDLSRYAGLMVAIKGLGSRLIVESLARSINGSNNAILEMEVGVLSCDQLNTMLRTTHAPQHAVAIIDANLSALDIYGRYMLDFVLNRIATGALPSSTILLSLSDSPISVDLSHHFLQATVLFDLDNFNESGTDIGDSPHEIKDVLLDKDDTALSNILWQPAVKRLREYMSNISDDNEIFHSIAAIIEHQKNCRLM
jgi:hypothetical protein